MEFLKKAKKKKNNFINVESFESKMDCFKILLSDKIPKIGIETMKNKAPLNQ